MLGANYWVSVSSYFRGNSAFFLFWGRGANKFEHVYIYYCCTDVTGSMSVNQTGRHTGRKTNFKQMFLVSPL